MVNSPLQSITLRTISPSFFQEASREMIQPASTTLRPHSSSSRLASQTSCTNEPSNLTHLNNFRKVLDTSFLRTRIFISSSSLLLLRTRGEGLHLVDGSEDRDLSEAFLVYTKTHEFCTFGWLEGEGKKGSDSSNTKKGTSRQS